MLETIIFSIIGAVSLVSIVFVALAISTRDLLKAVIYSAVQSTLYAFLMYLLMAPDIVLVYVAVSVGLLPLITIALLKKVGRYE
ncbi:MAG: hydrogenase subunit MbhD domain-containing protein [Desulfurococcaceae archaeon]